MQADKLRELRALLAKATPGGWRQSDPMETFGCVWSKGRPSFVIADVASNHLSTDEQRANGALIAAMHEALPELLAIAEGAEADRAALRELADEFNGCGDHSRHKQAAEAWHYCAKKVAALAGAVTQGES